MKAFLKIAAVALAFATPIAASATTLATFDITNGTWIIGSSSETYTDANGNTITAASQAVIAGNFAGNILAPLPIGAIMDYTISATLMTSSVDLGGALPTLTESVTVSGDIGDVIPIALGIGNLLVANAGVPLDFGVGQLTYGGTLASASATSVSGTFFINALGVAPLGDLANGFLAGLNLPLPQGFFLPNDDSGTFSLSLSIETPMATPVPLPAGGLLLLGGLGAFAVTRRRKTAA